MLTSLMMATVLAATAQAAPSQTVEVTAEREERPAILINRAASMSVQGRTEEAIALYRRIEAQPAGYELETTDGRWMYPAEIARRSLKQIERGQVTRIAVRTR